MNPFQKILSELSKPQEKKPLLSVIESRREFYANRIAKLDAILAASKDNPALLAALDALWDEEQ